ncbi:cobalamin biosynthesis protein CobW [Serinibacter arcticus]|uniref:Cobalamin biosynthesis protein CobW n=1 Tax=Serinibacter arcticus TaxID=1655435 RepID=A0A2U1ZWS0_9MICO|nr:GTP-binding protein [Serinibacter arcticus]PWD51421.1 cobalamin biosynthesis protein CobW [Serinibacter arcticus]
MTSPTTVVVLAATDPAEREAALVTALLDHPDVLAVVHDLEQRGDDVVLRRRVVDPRGPGSDEIIPMEHACAGCALREDAIPAIADLLAREPRGIVLALPLGAEILPATRILHGHAGPDGPLAGVRLGATVAVVNAAEIEGDLLDGDDALLSHLVSADIILLDHESPAAHAPAASAQGAALADTLRWARSTRHDDLCHPWLDAALAGSHDPVDLDRRHDPATLDPADRFTATAPATPPLEAGPADVWTLDLHSSRPFHPDRVLATMSELATARTVSRGRFWLPNRPDAVCGWEALGGTVCVGVAGTWDEAEPSTALQVTGVGPGAEAVRRAFERALLDDVEMAAGPATWLGREDPFEPYLGSPADLYRGDAAA